MLVTLHHLSHGEWFCRLSESYSINHIGAMLFLKITHTLRSRLLNRTGHGCLLIKLFPWLQAEEGSILNLDLLTTYWCNVLNRFLPLVYLSGERPLSQFRCYSNSLSLYRGEWPTTSIGSRLWPFKLLLAGSHGTNFVTTNSRSSMNVTTHGSLPGIHHETVWNLTLLLPIGRLCCAYPRRSLVILYVENRLTDLTYVASVWPNYHTRLPTSSDCSIRWPLTLMLCLRVFLKNVVLELFLRVDHIF